ncbi:MAG: SusC/RagA family TonB-linked outer membrane protein, partial [Niabella sp.]
MLLPKISYLFLAFSLFLTADLYCQALTVIGTVRDIDDDKVLTGVSVQLKGHGIAGTTDKDGKFSITARQSDTLVFTYIGYQSVWYPVEIVLKEGGVNMMKNAADMEEVVVVAYGTVKKRDLTGSVSQVNVQDLIKAPVPSFDQALAGRIAGVQVASNDGQPGSGMNIVIRGGNSLTQSNEPLFVVDGFPVENFNSNAIAPEDIASITVLKDASATAIYGSMGANGVVIIETKSGVPGKINVGYHGYIGQQSVIREVDVMSPYEFVKYQIERDNANMTNRYLTERSMTLEDYKNINKVNWQELLFKPALMQNHTVSLQGGSKQTQYSASASYFDQDGIAINSGYNRLQTRAALKQTVNDRLTADFNINYAEDKNYGALTSEQGSTANSFSTYLMYQVWGIVPFVPDPDGDVESDLFPGLDDGDGDTRILNPIVASRNVIRQRSTTNLLANARIDYKLSKELNFMVRGGINRYHNEDESFYNSRTYQGFPWVSNVKGVNGAFRQANRNGWIAEGTLTYRKNVSKRGLLDAMIGSAFRGTSLNGYGYSVYNIENEEYGLIGLKFGSPTLIISDRSKNLMGSYLARLNYNYNSKYLFTASFRADGSSKFIGKNRWGYFPSGAFAWQMGEEGFMKGIEFISNAKLRLSYGVTGNNRVGDFAQYPSIAFSDYYSFGNATPHLVAVMTNLGDPDLKWESTTQTNIGYDLSLFNKKVELTLDYYIKDTRDLLLNANLPTSTGYNSYYTNVGRVKNEGLEISLNTINVKRKHFSWESNFNISFNRNKVVELADAQSTLFSSVSWTSNYNNSFLYLAQVGAPAAQFYGYLWDGNYQYEDFDIAPGGGYVLKSTVPANGTARANIRPGDIKYVDQNG